MSPLPCCGKCRKINCICERDDQGNIIELGIPIEVIDKNNGPTADRKGGKKSPKFW
jgi:hypothetical protein